jgi:hypothetical protein
MLVIFFFGFLKLSRVWKTISLVSAIFVVAGFGGGEALVVSAVNTASVACGEKQSLDDIAG